MMTLFAPPLLNFGNLARKSQIFLIVIALSFSAFVSSAPGAQITLAWDAAASSEIAGYRMHYGTSSGHYTASIDAGRNTTCTVPGLTIGTTYFFAVTAYTSDGAESSHSNEVSYTMPAEVTLSSITVDGPTQVSENSSAQFTCTAHYSDGSSAALTSGVAWSENTAAATINASGVLAAGSVDSDTAVTITATYGGKTDSHAITINDIPSTLSSIAISGPTQVSENSSAQFTCTARYSDGSSATLTSGVTWSENTAAATINASGVLAAGSVDSDAAVTITATYGGKTDSHAITIKDIPPTLSAIAISGPIQVGENSSAQFTCTAYYSDGSSAALTSGVTWSENTAAATISSSGKLSAGSVPSDTAITVTAAYSDQTDTHSVTIKKSAVALTSLFISGPDRLDEQSSGQYTCTARYSDNSTSMVTDSVQWSVNSGLAAISASGQLTTRAVQTEEHVTITATFDGQQAVYDLIIDNSKSNYSLSVDITGAGAVLLDPPGGIYDKGTVVTLTAEADRAWAFDGWIGAVADTESSITSVIMDSDIDLSATFLEDTDLDSVPDQEEWGSDSMDPDFDGNADGIADYLQGSVASMHTKDYLSYISLSAMDPGRITMCEAFETYSIAAAPTDYSLPLGLVAVRIEDIPPGASTTLTIHLPVGSEFDTFYKYGPTLDDPSDHWYEFMYDDISETGAVIDGDTITLYFKDGSRGDSDLAANGVISDPGGPAIIGADPAPPGQQLSDDNPSISVPAGGGTGCFIHTLFMSLH